MTCNWKVRLLIATVLVVTWATSAEACRWRRSCAPDPCAYSTFGYASPQGYYGADGGYYYGGRYAGGTAAYPGTYGGYGYGGYGYGRYDFGRPGYNPGGLGGPASGLGVRPGLGVGGFGPGR
jgi:hypothetical protein